MRIFQPVCIVFISPPGVEVCLLPLYCACFVRVSCVFHVVYVSPVRTLPASMCFPRVRRRIGAVQSVWSRTENRNELHMFKPV